MDEKFWKLHSPRQLLFLMRSWYLAGLRLFFEIYIFFIFSLLSFQFIFRGLSYNEGVRTKEEDLPFSWR